MSHNVIIKRRIQNGKSIVKVLVAKRAGYTKDCKKCEDDTDSISPTCEEDEGNNDTVDCKSISLLPGVTGPNFEDIRGKSTINYEDKYPLFFNPANSTVRKPYTKPLAPALGFTFPSALSTESCNAEYNRFFDILKRIYQKTYNKVISDAKLGIYDKTGIRQIVYDAMQEFTIYSQFIAIANSSEQRKLLKNRQLKYNPEQIRSYADEFFLVGPLFRSSYEASNDAYKLVFPVDYDLAYASAVNILTYLSRFHDDFDVPTLAAFEKARLEALSAITHPLNDAKKHMAIVIAIEAYYEVFGEKLDEEGEEEEDEEGGFRVEDSGNEQPDPTEKDDPERTCEEIRKRTIDDLEQHPKTANVDLFKFDKYAAMPGTEGGLPGGSTMNTLVGVENTFNILILNLYIRALERI